MCGEQIPTVEFGMKVSYNKLWHLLLDRRLKKTELKNRTGISATTLANMAQDKNVSLDVLLRICEELNCNFSDIMDAIPDEGGRKNLLRSEKELEIK